MGRQYKDIKSEILFHTLTWDEDTQEPDIKTYVQRTKEHTKEQTLRDILLEAAGYLSVCPQNSENRLFTVTITAVLSNKDRIRKLQFCGDVGSLIHRLNEAADEERIF